MQRLNTSMIRLKWMCFVSFPLAKSTDHFSLRSQLLPVLTTWTCCSCGLMPQLQEDIVDFIFQQEGAPPHYHLDVRAHLKGILPGCWIGRASHDDSPLLPWPNPLRFFLMGLHQGSCVHASYATWFTTAATKDRGGSRFYRPPNVATLVAGTWLQDWHLTRHQGCTYRAPVS